MYINHTTLADQIFYGIKARILSGKILPGEKISVKKIADLFDVSQTPAREAFLRLSEYGLLKIKEGPIPKLCRLMKKKQDK